MSGPDRPVWRRPSVTRPCPCGCGTRLRRSRMVCEETWARIPADLRQATQDADEAWKVAMDAAFAWLNAHPETWAGARPGSVIGSAGTDSPAGTDDTTDTGTDSPTEAGTR